MSGAALIYSRARAETIFTTLALDAATSSKLN